MEGGINNYVKYEAKKSARMTNELYSLDQIQWFHRGIMKKFFASNNVCPPPLEATENLPQDGVRPTPFS